MTRGKRGAGLTPEQRADIEQVTVIMRGVVDALASDIAADESRTVIGDDLYGLVQECARALTLLGLPLVSAGEMRGRLRHEQRQAQERSR